MAWRQGASAPFGSWAYTHNNRGQRISSTDITGRAATYGYDAASRLSSETISGDPRGAAFNGALSYVVDAVGNRSSRTSTLAALGAQSFTYNANDEISGDSFDANGNTLSSGGHTFAYDFENRLVSKDSGTVTVTYDCDGNRVAKNVAGVTTRYLVDDLNPTGYLQVLEEVVGGAVQTRYTYGTSIVSQTRNVSATAVTSFYGYDGHGNIAFLTDAIGALTDSYDFDAWGAVVAHTGSTLNTRLYAGEEFDPDLGLINLRARQYDSNVGRFLTLDPLMGDFRKPTSLNRYNYTSVDPVNFRDPLGLVEFAEDSGLKSGVAGTLTMSTTIELGYAAKTTADIIKAAAAAYAAGCAMFIVASAIAGEITGVEQPPPPWPFTLCRVKKKKDPCRAPNLRCRETGASAPGSGRSPGHSLCDDCLEICQGQGSWPSVTWDGKVCPQ